MSTGIRDTMMASQSFCEQITVKDVKDNGSYLLVKVGDAIFRKQPAETTQIEVEALNATIQSEKRMFRALLFHTTNVTNAEKNPDEIAKALGITDGMWYGSHVTEVDGARQIKLPNDGNASKLGDGYWFDLHMHDVAYRIQRGGGTLVLLLLFAKNEGRTSGNILHIQMSACWKSGWSTVTKGNLTVNGIFTGNPTKAVSYNYHAARSYDKVQKMAKRGAKKPQAMKRSHAAKKKGQGKRREMSKSRSSAVTPSKVQLIDMLRKAREQRQLIGAL